MVCLSILFIIFRAKPITNKIVSSHIKLNKPTINFSDNLRLTFMQFTKTHLVLKLD